MNEVSPATQDCTIIIPAYNEEAGIAATLEELLSQTKDMKVLVVNDGSKDRTKESILPLMARFPNLEYVEHRLNRGYGAALKTGVRRAQTNFIMTYDADGQHQPDDAKRILETIRSTKADLVVGARGKSAYQVPWRQPGKWVLKQIANILAEADIPDLNSGLRVFRRDTVEAILPLLPEGFSFSTTSTLSLYRFRRQIDFVPIVTRKRTGVSTVRIKHGFQTLMLIIRLVALFQPLKIFLPISLFLMISGLTKGILWDLLFRSANIAISSLLVFLTGVVLLAFGIMADQVSALRLGAIKLPEENGL